MSIIYSLSNAFLTFLSLRVLKMLRVQSVLLGLLLSTCVSAASSVSATFNNAIKYQFDTDGNAIDSTSGKIDFLNGEYVSHLERLYGKFKESWKIGLLLRI
jgi:hypothetical protein